MIRLFSPLRFLQAFAQFAHIPGSASSGLFLINTNLNKIAGGKISARNSAGAGTRIALGSLTQDAGGRLDLALNPGGALSVKTAGTGSFLDSLRAEADRSIGGTVLFETSSGTTGVGASRPLYSFVAPFEVAGGGANTGLAITTTWRIGLQESTSRHRTGTACLRAQRSSTLRATRTLPSSSVNCL